GGEPVAARDPTPGLAKDRASAADSVPARDRVTVSSVRLTEHPSHVAYADRPKTSHRAVAAPGSGCANNVPQPTRTSLPPLGAIRPGHCRLHFRSGPITMRRGGWPVE